MIFLAQFKEFRNSKVKNKYKNKGILIYIIFYLLLKIKKKLLIVKIFNFPSNKHFALKILYYQLLIKLSFIVIIG